MNPKYYSNTPVAFGRKNSIFQGEINFKISVLTDRNVNSHNIS